MAAVMNQEDSDSEYQDAQEDFHNVKRNEKKNTERSRLEDLPLPVPSPGPVAPPRVKRNKKKQLEKERGSKGGLDEGTTEKNQPSPSKCPDLSRPPNALTAERIMETQDLVDNDPSVTIKEEGLLMNPELLQTSQVTVTSETPMKRSGRVAGEYRESIVSSSDSGEESAGRDGDGTLKELQPMEKCDATPVKKETEGARASLSDSEILQLVMVKNLDTGECKPLSEVETIAPKGTDPISLHIMKLTSDFGSSEDSRPTPVEEGTGPRKKPKKKLKNLFRKGKHDDRSTVEGAGPHSDEDMQGEGQPEAPMAIKYRPAHNFKGPYDFAETRLKQELVGGYQHVDAIWTMKFSICGRLLATGGQDNTVRVWVLRSAYQFFHDLQVRYARVGASADSLSSKSTSSSQTSQDSDVEEDPSKPFKEKPLCIYTGHRADVLDMSWSKNFFLLSSSMDKTVKLWHISRKECLCCFQHSEFVTSIAFHPRDDRYFLSGSLDGKLRLWNIPDKKVALWNEIEGVGSKLITAANFCGKGKYVVVGTYDGRCLFYDTEHLKYHTQIQVRSRHGKNAKGRKISGLEPLLGEDKLLVTSNDSRIRLYNLKDHSLICKFKGCVNNSSQIKASFNHDAKFIICGSEDHAMYLWRTYNAGRLPSGRRDRNDFFECISAHSAVVTVAIFAPVPGLFANEGLREVGEVIVSADYQGGIKVFVCGPDL